MECCVCVVRDGLGDCFTEFVGFVCFFATIFFTSFSLYN